MKSILMTGGAGFIGSNFVSYFLESHKDYHLINLDYLTYAADLNNITLNTSENTRYTFVKGSICDRPLVEKLFTENNIQGVIHFAAESHVDNSIENPSVFIETNVNGTFTLLDVAYKKWMEAPFTHKEAYKESRFLHVSTQIHHIALQKLLAI